MNNSIGKNKIRLLLPLALTALVYSTYSAESLTKYHWKNRPLLIFSSHKSDSRLIRQTRIIEANRLGISERDMVVIFVVGSSVNSLFGDGPELSARELRARYVVRGREFRSILIGKDRGMKLSSSPPLSAQGLFSVIDEMPMRRQEMKQKRR